MAGGSRFGVASFVRLVCGVEMRWGLVVMFSRGLLCADLQRFMGEYRYWHERESAAAWYTNGIINKHYSGCRNKHERR